jgi:hypothetical protein
VQFHPHALWQATYPDLQLFLTLFGLEVQEHHLISLGGWNDVISISLGSAKYAGALPCVSKARHTDTSAVPGFEHWTACLLTARFHSGTAWYGAVYTVMTSRIFLSNGGCSAYEMPHTIK